MPPSHVGSTLWTVGEQPPHTCCNEPACVLDEPGGHDDEQHGGTSFNPAVVQPVGSARSGTDLPPTDCPVQSTDRTGTGWSPGHQDQPPGCPCGHDADEHGRCVVSYPPPIKCFYCVWRPAGQQCSSVFHVESYCYRRISTVAWRIIEFF